MENSQEISEMNSNSNVNIRKPPKKSEDIQAILQQNAMLKSELLELAKQMDDHVEKQKQKPNNQPQSNEKSQILKDQQQQILKNKQKITQLKKQLENTYDINRIVAKEDELKVLKMELEGLLQEKESLQKIEKEQAKAMNSLQDDSKQFIVVQDQKYDKLKEDLRMLRVENKKLQEQLTEKEKVLRNLHEQTIIKEEKIKEIQQRVKEKKSQPQAEEITEQMIQDLENKLKALIQERENAEKKGTERVKELEKEKKNLQAELEKKQIILKAKEKQAKLNQIKIKEIMRIAKFGQIQGNTINLDDETSLIQQTPAKISQKQSNNTSFQLEIQSKRFQDQIPKINDVNSQRQQDVQYEQEFQVSQQIQPEVKVESEKLSERIGQNQSKHIQLTKEAEPNTETQEQPENKAFTKPMMRRKK